jgi:hypothetical protein
MLLRIAKQQPSAPSRQQELDWLCFQVSWLVAKGARLEHLGHIVDGLAAAAGGVRSWTATD